MRKPAGASWESFVERRIREAEAAGKFDNLPGAGQPIPGIEEQADENWWLKRKLRDEQLSILPPILEARLALQRVLEGLPRLTSEADVRRRLAEVNEQIRAAIASPAPAPAVIVAPIDIEQCVAEWLSFRGRPAANQPGSAAQAATWRENASPRAT